MSSSFSSNLVARGRAIFSCLTLCLVYGCATPPPPPAPAPMAAPDYWSVSRAVNSANGLITLLDPESLVHHESDPEHWYLHDFAFANDLETGRMVAVLSRYTGLHNVRLTTGPLTDAERAAAGPYAQQRLRVINGRLLLSGGDTLPNDQQRAIDFAYDSRWIDFPNGDYQATVTAIDVNDDAPHDYVIQLLEMGSLRNVDYAPGIPKLVVGEQAKVVGLNSRAPDFQPECRYIPTEANWNPLSSHGLPIPGREASVEIADKYYQKAMQQQQAGAASAMPLIMSRETNVGSVGVFIKPSTWQPLNNPSSQPVSHTKVLCGVQITGVKFVDDTFTLQVRPLSLENTPLSGDLAAQLRQRFSRWARLTSQPGWYYKSGEISRSPNDRALVLNILRYLDLPANEVESMLLLPLDGMAKALLSRFPDDAI